MERIKAEYLQKILEQVNNQNVEYFENLACEYTLQYQVLMQNKAMPIEGGQISNADVAMFSKDCGSAQPNEGNQIQENKAAVSSFEGAKQNDQAKDALKIAPKTAAQQSKMNDLCQRNEDDFDEAMIDEEGGVQSQMPSFMKNPEVIKMHLDILYKSIGFLSEQKIITKIEQYKQAKE